MNVMLAIPTWVRCSIFSEDMTHGGFTCLYESFIKVNSSSTIAQLHVFAYRSMVYCMDVVQASCV